MVLSQQTTIFAVYFTKLGGSPALYGGLMAAGSLLVGTPASRLFALIDATTALFPKCTDYLR